MQQQLLGYPEVITNLRFFRTQTVPFGEWSMTSVKLQRDGLAKRPTRNEVDYSEAMTLPSKNARHRKKKECVFNQFSTHTRCCSIRVWYNIKRWLSSHCAHLNYRNCVRGSAATSGGLSPKENVTSWTHLWQSLTMKFQAIHGMTCWGDACVCESMIFANSSRCWRALQKPISRTTILVSYKPGCFCWLPHLMVMIMRGVSTMKIVTSFFPIPVCLNI